MHCDEQKINNYPRRLIWGKLGILVFYEGVMNEKFVAVSTRASDRFRVPMPPGKSWIFFLKFLGPGNSWIFTFKFLESPGIYLWFSLINMPFITPCVNNKCMKYSCYVLTEQFLCNLVNVMQWIVLSHCIYRVRNCCLSVI